ncbi:pseudouridine synthase family protein [Eionea flava]
MTTPPLIIETTIAQNDTTSIDCLSAACELSKSKLKECMKKGAVWLQRHGTSTSSIRPIRRAKTRLACGDKLFLYFNAAVLEQTPPTPKLIDDQQDYSLWYKPSGMFSHGSKWGDHCSITRWIEQHQQPQRHCYLVHRLDRATAGIMLIAHTKKVAAQLCEQFEKRHTHKRYRALVAGKFPEQLKEQIKNKVTSHCITLNTSIEGKIAHTDVQLIEYNSQQDVSLLDITLHTGRKHQIRKHLSQAGCPILGDRLYNPQFADNSTLDKESITATPDLQLQAYHLGFNCPISHTYQEVTLPEAQLLSPQNNLYKK